MTQKATFSEGNFLTVDELEEGWHDAKLVSLEPYKGPSMYDTPSYWLRWEITGGPSGKEARGKTTRELVSGTLSKDSKMYARWLACGGDELGKGDDVDLEDIVECAAQLFLSEGKSKKGVAIISIDKIRAPRKKSETEDESEAKAEDEDEDKSKDEDEDEDEDEDKSKDEDEDEDEDKSKDEDEDEEVRNPRKTKGLKKKLLPKKKGKK